MSPMISPTLGGLSKIATISIPAVAQGAPVPPELIKCQCKAQDKQCSTEACRQHLACTSYCNCSGMTVAIRTLWYSN